MEDIENCPRTKYITSKKIQTFSFVPPKSDIFLDLNQTNKLRAFDKNNRIEVITVERPTPKLIYELAEEPFKSRVRNQLINVSWKCQRFLRQVNSHLNEHLSPRLSPLRFSSEVILSNLLMISSVPIIFLWIILVLTIRLGVFLYLKARYKDEFELMKGADAAWGIQSYANDNCFISIYTVQGECSIEKIRNRIKASVIDRTDSGKLIYNRMKQLIVSKCGFFCWKKFSEFNIKEHVKVLRDNPHLEMSQDDIFNEIRRFVDEPLNPSRPQWELWIVPKFISGNIDDSAGNWSLVDEEDKSSKHYALIWRINKSIMDETSLANTLQQFIADSPVKMELDPTAPINTTWKQTLLIYFQMLFLGSRSFIKSVVTKDTNCFQQGSGLLTGHKTLMWSRPLSIQSLKQIKNVMDSSITAVIVSSFGGALRNMALRKNLPVPEKITGGATCTVLPYPDFGPHNRSTVVSFSLNLDIQCPKERLQSASDSVDELTNVAEILKNSNLLKFIGLNPIRWINRIMTRIQKATFLMSNINVPGPTETYTIFQGDKLVDIATWNPINGNSAIGISLFSYAGKIRAGIIADGSVLPNSADVPALVQDFESEILELAKICGIPEEFVFWDIF